MKDAFTRIMPQYQDAAGSVKVNLRPPPGAFSTVMSPPIAVMIRWTRGNPSPAPPFLRARPVSTR